MYAYKKNNAFILCNKNKKEIQRELGNKRIKNENEKNNFKLIEFENSYNFPIFSSFIYKQIILN